MAKPTQKDIDRFWSKVDIRSKSECWEWMAFCKPNGYGQFQLKRNKPVYAHRFVWLIIHGVWPDKNILHECDNPPCVNPNHLFEGTQLDNIHDCIKKGRFVNKNNTGIKNPNVKLTEKDIRQIRREYVAKDKNFGAKPLAKKYGVKPAAISKIITRRNWKHV